MATGIAKRHSAGCPALTGGRCKCRAGWQASVYSPADDKQIRKRFRRKAEAISWRAQAKAAIDRGTLRAPAPTTLSAAAAAWLAGAEAGEIRNRSGQPYKPATLRGYRQALEAWVLPELGARKIAQITTWDLQQLVDRWVGEGHAASTIRNAIKPLQAIYRRACAREGLAVDPTRDLEMPAPRPQEVEIVAPAVALRLLAAVPAEDRAVWGTAIYAGLRYGELRALRWGAVDLAGGRLHVIEAWDPKEGAVAPKTETSRRRVPIPGGLRDLLIDHRLRSGQPSADALVFGEGGMPFHAVVLYRRADAAWKAAGLPNRLRFHQARHTYASFMIAAGVNPKDIATYMGHSSIKLTYDLYGHLLPGAEAGAAEKLDALLASAAQDAEGTPIT